MDFLFDLAFRHHRAGQLAEAESLYRQVLAAQPHHANALHLLGVVELQNGHPEPALDLIRRSLAIDPGNADAQSNLGEVWRALGRLDEALVCFRRAIELQPDRPEMHNNLGNVFLALNRVEEAAAAYRDALRLQPTLPEANYNLGNALRIMGRTDEALATYRRTMELSPRYVPAIVNFGTLLMERDQLDEAMRMFESALEIDPQYAEGHNNLGNALRQRGQLEHALAAYSRAYALRPDVPLVCNNLGVALTDLGRFAESQSVLHRALNLAPAYAEAHNNLGNLLANCGRFAEAEDAYRRALELDPNLTNAKFGRAVLRLRSGDFEHGWPMYEARWDMPGTTRRTFAQPEWRGEELAGKSILLHAEQGLGDSIQFVRFAAVVAARGAEVVVECPRELVELFRTARGVRDVVCAGEPLPAFDVQLPMLSLPRVFQTKHETIPGEVPYLFSDPQRREQWAQRLGKNRSRLRVGLAWAGRPTNRQNRVRNLPFAEMRRLLGAENVEFFSLQIGGGPQGQPQISDTDAIVDHTAHLANLADTAALMAHLDLIISVDTAVAHLAGALGRPTWILLPFVPDWRWGLNSEESAWYPTMRLFRQPSLGDWDAVINRVIAALAALANQ